MLQLLCKWPSRARPRLLEQVFPRWDVGCVRFLFSLDSDDPALPEYRAFLDGRENVKVCVGRPGGKISAYNRDLAGEDFGVLVVASDDFVPQREDWPAEITRLMAKHFPDGDGMLHCNDGRNGRTLCTMPIMGKVYYDRFSYVYHEHYRALWCDNEAQEVAQRLGRIAYVDEVIFKHNWIGMEPDDLLRHNESFYDQDMAVFKRRQRAGFP